MAASQRRLWLGDWQQHETPPPPPRPATAAAPKLDARKRRTRARLITAALATAAFAWPFGYLIGQLRAGHDPGLRTGASATTPGGYGAPGDQAPSEGPPPVTTRQS